MSKVGVIVALVIALLLAAALYVATRGSVAPPPSGPLLNFDAAKAAQIRISRADGSFEAAVRTSTPGAWEIVLGNPAREHRWPASAARIRAALRVLSTLEASQEAQGGLEPGAPELSITLDDGGTRRMKLSGKVIGGRAMVELADPSRSAWINADVADMLVGTGLKEWRERAALPTLGPDTSRITLRGERGTVQLARIQGRWGIQLPVQEPADPDAVVKLLTALGSVQIADFLDAGAPAQTGLDAPVAELTIEADERDPDGKLTTRRAGLRLGRQADIAGKTIFAALITGDQAAPREVTITAEPLAALSTDWLTFASRRSLAVPAADVGLIRIDVGTTPVEFARTLDGWTRRIGESPAERASPADLEALAALLNLLVQTPADVVLAAGSSAAEPLAKLVVATAAGTRIAELAVSTADNTVQIRSGAATRVYTSAGPIAVWLASLK